jgi:hypothetical protein
VEDWGNITGMWTTISIMIHLAAPKVRILHLQPGKPGTATLMINYMVVLTINVIIRRIDSSSQDQYHKSSRVLFSPTLFQAMSGSVLEVLKENCLTKISAKALDYTFDREDL